MSRFNRLSQAIWHCKYHIVWTPKYRYKILKGPLKDEVYNCINVFPGQNNCIVDELNIQAESCSSSNRSTTKVVDIKFNVNSQRTYSNTCF